MLTFAYIAVWAYGECAPRSYPTRVARTTHRGRAIDTSFSESVRRVSPSPQSPKKVGHGQGLLALSPLFVFIVLYLVTSLVSGDFYAMPITVAFMASSIYAIATSKGSPIMHRIAVYSRGAGTSNLMLMLWIFVLAGAFAASAKGMGCVDATVNLTLSLLPGSVLFLGLFLASCFISLSIGTSVGTIVALMPIALGIAQSTGADVAMVSAIVIGGSFFGDNLSFISDTTIVATTSQGCQPRDKFRANAWIAIPAAILMLGVYYFLGSGIQSPTDIPDIEIVKVLPYLAVLIAALCGVNVMVVLTGGIALTGIIGIADGSYDYLSWFKSMGNGITGMGELIIITMMAGGLLEIVRLNGGIDYITQKLTARIRTSRGAELSVGLLVSLVDACTANNTVAILTVGDIAKYIAVKYHIDPRKMASVLDTFSCCVQGLIPYGAQLLIAAGLAKLNPLAFIPWLFYPMALGVATILAILFRYPRKYSLPYVPQKNVKEK